MTPGAIEHVCAGELLWLMPEHAIFWPAQSSLLVADVHLGKAAAFRALGQPVPAGTTRATLARLSHALTATGAERLIVLGDLVHARESQPALMAAGLAAWRERHAGVECVLIEGNHDRGAATLPPWRDLVVQQEPWRVGPFALCHEPKAAPGCYTLAGHVHPVRVLHGSGRDRLRLPCFDFGPQIGILPAFGAFTGGYERACGPGHQHYVVAGTRVMRVP